MKQTTLEQPSVTLARTAVPKPFDPGNSVDHGAKLFLLLPPDDQPEASTESTFILPDPTSLIEDPPSESPLHSISAPANFRPSMPTLLAGLAAMVGVAGFLAIRQQQLGINPSELISPSEDTLSAVLDQTYEAKQALTIGTLPPTQPSILIPTRPGTVYTVKAGDTIEGIAKQYQVSQPAIVQANQLSDPNWLKQGQKLTIPSTPAGSAVNPANSNPSPTLSVTIESNPPATVTQKVPAATASAKQVPTTHTVVAGETLSQIAEQYQVPQRAIMRANALANDRWLSLGQKLVIPAPETTAVKPPAPAVKPKPIAALPPKLAPTKAPVIARQVKPTTPKRLQGTATHTIQSGDTIEAMALQYKVSQRALLNANPQLDPLRLQLGQPLLIPGQDPVKPSQPISQTLKPKSTQTAKATKPQPAKPQPTTAAKLQALAAASRAKAVQTSKSIANPQPQAAAAKPPLQAPPKPTAPKQTIEIAKPKSTTSRAILPLDPGKPLPGAKPPVVQSSPAQALTSPSVEVKPDPIPELTDPPIAAKPTPQLNRLSKPELPAQPSQVTKLLQPADPVPTVASLPEPAPVAAAKPVPSLKRLDKPELPSQPSRVARLLNPVVPKQAPVEVAEPSPPDAPVQAAAPAPLPPVPPPISAPAVTAPPATSTSTRFVWPVAGRITSGFGWRGSRMHAGIDIPGPVGSPIVAVMEGVVVFAGNQNDGYGNRVDIRHPNGLVTRYAHGSQVFVSTGQTVQQGQTIMSRGSTGWSTGPHLHFEVRPGGGAAVDPRPYLQ